MSERRRTGPGAGRYATWLAIPLTFLAVSLWIDAGRGGLRAPQSEFRSGVGNFDAKLRRTLARFDPERLLEEEPNAVGGEGLPLEIDVPPRVLRLMRIPENRARFKDREVDAVVRFGAGLPVPAALALRGDTSLWHGEKLNFELELVRPQPFEDGPTLQRIFLMAMNEDPHQIVSRFGYRIYGSLGLFPLHVRFVRIALNGEREGLYLLIEPPSQGLRRLYPDLVALHRRLGRFRYQTYWADRVPAVSASLNAFRALRHQRLEDPAAAYARHVDLHAYLTYQAANAILMNRDTQAELFLYERREDPDRPAPLRFMAWDADTIGSQWSRPDAIDDPLIFSTRDPFDRRIHEEPTLRSLYVRTLERVLERPLTADFLSETLREVRELRDALDDGRPVVEQVAARRDRARFASELESQFLARREELLREIAAATH